MWIQIMFFNNVGALRDPNTEFSHYEIIRNLTEDGAARRGGDDGSNGGARVFLAIPWAEPRFGHAGGFLL